MPRTAGRGLGKGKSRRKKADPKKRKKVKVALKIKGNVDQVQKAVMKMAGNVTAGSPANALR